MAQLERQRTSKRESILEAALEVLCYYGYDGTTLDMIAEKAGVSKALVIKYFATKHNVLVLTLKRFVETLLETIADNSRGAGVTFADHMDFVFEQFKAARPQMRLLLSIFLTPAHDDLTRELGPGYLQVMHSILGGFPETRDLPGRWELNYTLCAQIAAYIIGGNEENYKQARETVMTFYLAETGET